MNVTPEQAAGMAQIFIGMVEREAETTKKVLAALPQDKLDFKLGEKGRTARELAWHIASVDVWFAQSVADGAFGMEDGGPGPDTVAGIVAYYEKNLPEQLARVKALKPEALAKVISFYNVFHLPAVMYLNFLNSHMIHHRGQLSTYLRAMNAHVPSIYGGSADEPFEMPATA